MKTPRLFFKVALAGLVCLGSSAVAEEIRLSEIQNDEEFAAEMPVTGTVETFFGDFELEHSFPTAETANSSVSMTQGSPSTTRRSTSPPLSAGTPSSIARHGRRSATGAIWLRFMNIQKN